MARRALPRLALSLALALLTLALASPGVSADHTYAHRYYLTGRVVDADGAPVSNVSVRAVLDSGVEVRGSGHNEQAIRVYRSDCDGLFGWFVNADLYKNREHPTVSHSFLHVHDAAATGKLEVEAVNAPFPTTDGFYPGSETKHLEQYRDIYYATDVLAAASPPFDPLFRESFVLFQLPARTDAGGVECEGAQARFDREYHVFGHVMREIPPQIRDGGARVISEPVVGEVANVTLRYNDGLTATGQGTTDREGHYALVLSLAEPLRTGELTVDTNGTIQTYEANPRYHLTSVETLPGKARAPLVSFTAVADGLMVKVDASATTGAGGPLRAYRWDWGDGTAAGTGLKANHTYATAGTYTVTLRAVDHLGALSTSGKEVTVAAAATKAPGTESPRATPALPLAAVLLVLAAVVLARRAP